MLHNKVLRGNGSATALAGDAVYTGTAEDVSAFNTITVQAYSDAASATNGLSMQFSTDGTNWDSVTTASVSAATVDVTVLHVRAQYFRVVYTNGVGAQTEFRLSCLGQTASMPAALAL